MLADITVMLDHPIGVPSCAESGELPLMPMCAKREFTAEEIDASNPVAPYSRMHRFHSASMRKPRMRRGVATWLGSGKLLGR
jgi:hypothetical protein